MNRIPHDESALLLACAGYLGLLLIGLRRLIFGPLKPSTAKHKGRRR